MSQDSKIKALFWFRRDLRLEDNTGLYHALKECDLVAPVFVFDKAILNELMSEDRRVEFIWETLKQLREQLNVVNSDILIKYGYSEDEIPLLAEKFKVNFVYANEDYEPKTIQRDGVVRDKLLKNGIQLKLFKDTVIFAKEEILSPSHQPLSVFTTYKNIWKKKLSKEDYQQFPVEDYLHKLAKFKSGEMPSLEYMGFTKTNLTPKLGIGKVGAEELWERFKNKVVEHYKVLRDIPHSSGVSYLSTHNRFGTISVRRLVSDMMELIESSDAKKRENCETWLNEIIWRDFYMQLLYNFPHLVYEPFRVEFKNYPWENNPNFFLAWCEGKTGYPLVDAAMIQLNNTGYMHNRLRMLTASFLTKHLFTDYKLGEDYFATKLLDFDLAANNGGWQWSASTGSDAQPFFRIFNPVKQSEKFDPDARFIKRYLPIFENVNPELLHEPWKHIEALKEAGIELGKDYPLPIINHEERRKMILKVYEDVIKP